MNEWVFRVICNYLEGRSITLNYLSEQVTTETTRGCIQGFIGGPLLWNVLIDPLLRKTEFGPARIQAFADDILVLAAADTILDLNQRVNGALKLVAD